MRATLLSAVSLSAALTAASAAQAQQVIGEVGFVGPESARYDAANDRYIIANLNDREAPNDGFISLLSPDGTVTELKWIAGGQNGVELDNPLGTFIHDGTLYVADTATVRLFDVETGAPTGSIPVEGAIRLNDLAIAEDGTIYLTDSGSNEQPGALYKVSPDGTVSEFAARSPDLQRPNGIAIMPDGNIVTGSFAAADLVIRTPEGEIVSQQTLPTGRIDGIVALEDGSLLVASQDGHVVYHVPAGGGEPTVVARDIEVPAAIGVDTMRNRLLVPQIAAATVTFVDLP